MSLVYTKLQFVLVLGPIRDCLRRNTSFHGGLHDSLGDTRNQPGIKRRRHNVFRSKFEFFTTVGTLDLLRYGLSGKLSEGQGYSHLHLLVDDPCAGIQRATEEEGEAHDVVDLIGVVRASRCDDGIGLTLSRLIWEDLRNRVGHSEDKRLLCHLGDILSSQQVRSAHTNKNISVDESLLQGTLRSVSRKLILPLVHAFLTTLIAHALSVADYDVLFGHTIVVQKFDAGDTSRTSTIQYDLSGVGLPTSQLARVNEASEADDSRAVLIVVEDWNWHELFELCLDFKAVRGPDVLQVNSTEARSQVLNAIYELFWILSVHANIDRLDACKLVEQNRLALHNRLRSEGTNISETQHGGAIGDYGDHVSLVGVSESVAGILVDLHARIGDSGRVSKGQVVLRVHRLNRFHGILSGARELVVKQRF